MHTLLLTWERPLDVRLILYCLQCVCLQNTLHVVLLPLKISYLSKERQHLAIDDMNRAVGFLQTGMRLVEVAERIGISQSVISRFWRGFRKNGSRAEQYPGRGCRTTAA